METGFGLIEGLIYQAAPAIGVLSSSPPLQQLTQANDTTNQCRARTKEMMFPTILIAGLVLLQSVGTNAACECGYRVPGSGALYTNRIHNDFSQEPDTESPELAFWDIQTWNSTLSGDDEGEVVKENLISNVWIEDGQLHLLQQGWNGEGTVKVAEIHSKEIQMYHGHFVARYRVRQNDTAEGGAVSGFFFYLVS